MSHKCLYPESCTSQCTSALGKRLGGLLVSTLAWKSVVIPPVDKNFSDLWLAESNMLLLLLPNSENTVYLDLKQQCSTHFRDFTTLNQLLAFYFSFSQNIEPAWGCQSCFSSCQVSSMDQVIRNILCTSGWAQCLETSFSFWRWTFLQKRA